LGLHTPFAGQGETVPRLEQDSDRLDDRGDDEAGAVLNAMRTVAAARMIAAPMMIGGGTAAASCQGIVIDARIMTVNVDAGTNAGDFKKALREHQQEIGRIVERAFEQNKRSKF
jgi:hypothetical protein